MKEAGDYVVPNVLSPRDLVPDLTILTQLYYHQVRKLNFGTYKIAVITLKCEQMSRVMRKPKFCICENKDADQLRGNHEADQRLGFRYIDSTVPILSKSEISSL